MIPYDQDGGVPPALVERIKGGPARPFPLTVAAAGMIADALEGQAEHTRKAAGDWFDACEDERTDREHDEDELVDLAFADEMDELAKDVRRWAWDVAGTEDPPARPARARAIHAARNAAWMAAAYLVVSGAAFLAGASQHVAILLGAAAVGFVCSKR